MATTNGCNPNSTKPPLPSNDANSPFYLITPPVESAQITGATHLLTSYDLQSAYNKFSSKKVKQNLSSFISHLPGPVDTPATEDNSGLLSLVQRHPPVMKEIKPLTGAQLTGFRLYPGPIPDQYKIPLLQETQSSKVKKHKKKKSKKRHQSGDLGLSLGAGGSSINLSSTISSSSSMDLKNGSTSLSALSSIAVATSRHNTNQSLSALTSADSNATPETASSTNEIPSSLTSDKKNRKRVYEERDEKKKKKDKKKKRKKEIPNLRMNFGGSGSSFGSSSPSSGSGNTDSIIQQTEMALQMQQVQSILQGVGEKCIPKCIPKPGSSLDRYESTCLADCTDRYLDTFKLVAKAYTNRLKQESSGGMGSAASSGSFFR